MTEKELGMLPKIKPEREAAGDCGAFGPEHLKGTNQVDIFQSCLDQNGCTRGPRGPIGSENEPELIERLLTVIDRCLQGKGHYDSDGNQWFRGLEYFELKQTETVLRNYRRLLTEPLYQQLGQSWRQVSQGARPSCLLPARQEECLDEEEVTLMTPIKLLNEYLDREQNNVFSYSSSYWMDSPKRGYEREFREASEKVEIL